MSSNDIRPPKPASRPERVSLWRYMKLFRADILSAQPAKLYGAWMAEFRTLFFRSYLVNDPQVIERVLKTEHDSFPKSNRISEGLRPLLGDSVFLTNGEAWKRQRRIIDPAFEGGRLREVFPSMKAASAATVARLAPLADGTAHDIEPLTSHAAADVIFRTLFSLPIDTPIAQSVFSQFRDYQRSQPLLNLAAFIRLPKWMPRVFRRQTSETAKTIRALIAELTETRLEEISQGRAPDDLATKIMTTPDPETGEIFSADEMVDQVAIFFLAGHETSASALAWTLYLLAMYPEWQDKIAEEVPDSDLEFSDLSKLRVTRDVFREGLRLYPPVPMMVREAAENVEFRRRDVKRGAQIVLSPWHLHRHTRLWDDPDQFDPTRFQNPEAKQAVRQAYMPFSSGPRVCTGAGFAMLEGVLMLADLVRAYRFELIQDRVPVPVAHLTVRAKDGIWLRISPRQDQSVPAD